MTGLLAKTTSPKVETLGTTLHFSTNGVIDKRLRKAFTFRLGGWIVVQLLCDKFPGGGETLTVTAPVHI